TAFNTIETIVPLVQSKRLRAIAVSTRERAPALPDVPTAAEAVIKHFEVAGWFGLLAPAGTSRTILEQVSTEIAKAMTTGVLRERALQEGAMPVASTPAQFDAFLREEITKWTKIINELGIKLD
ncbi:MAG TPA: tripartite tricarboxylate transporter substrate-binding protein, partial [Burkholderiales bacterium]|nr:tripartite tricarboxylate transporter substrate-binding protein [Burkholderiales bacterium]